MAKYHNKKATVNGISFDSKKEAERYLVLKQMEKDGEISDLRLQVPFELQPSCTAEDCDGKLHKIRPIKYIADFTYVKNGKEIVEDVKGKKTDVYMLKKKMFAKQFKKIIKET